MLANDEAVHSVVFGDGGVLASADVGAVHISMSTISVGLSGQLASAHADARQRFIAAPVFGRPEAAAAAQLFIVAAGARSAFDDYAALLGTMGQKTFYLGIEPSAANLVKLSGNFLIASVIESLGEALALIGKAGIDPRTYLEVLTSTLFNVPLYKIYGGLIVDRKFEPAGFAAPLGLKDIRLTLAAAEQLQVAMPVASLLRDRFLTLLARGGEAQDWSAIARLSAADAGLPDGR
jgi:3-hydroxyisobutyrate dehydrogenase-like beta-hydroxyacid dehydrogenase